MLIFFLLTTGVFSSPVFNVEEKKFIESTLQIPKLRWYPKSHDFGYVQEDQIYTTTFEIWNNGTGDMRWQVDPCQDWVTIFPRTGSSSGERDKVNLSINTHRLKKTSYEGNAAIHSAGDYIFYTYFIVTDVKLDVFPRIYDFGVVESDSIISTNFTISNAGEGMLNWSLSTLHDWISIYPMNGSITNKSQPVHLSIDTQKVDIPIDDEKIFINSTGGNDIFTFSFKPNHSPEKPIIQGQTKFRIKSVQHFNLSSEDFENDSLYYFIDWGDGQNTSWIGPFSSDKKINVSHTFNEVGSYEIKAKTKDTFGFESNWTYYPIKATFRLPLIQRMLYHFYYNYYTIF